jgi:hypothetical protein
MENVGFGLKPIDSVAYPIRHLKQTAKDIALIIFLEMLSFAVRL